MPTLVRMLVVVAVIAAVAYGAMVVMVTFFHPLPREITETISLPKPSK